jgi:hemerythrin-like domain-containing protein
MWDSNWPGRQDLRKFSLFCVFGEVCKEMVKQERIMMKPYDLLIHEHRLMERMVDLMREEIKCIRQTECVDLAFIDAVFDFIENYTGQMHYQKEDILFHELSRKKISNEDFMMMSELLEEHQAGRKLTGELLKARDNFGSGDPNSLPEIIGCLNAIITFFPQHIQKEEGLFFPRSEGYFNEKELQTMFREFRDFNEAMVCKHLGQLKYEKGEILRQK